MKKLKLLLVAILFAVAGVFAQAPQSFKYQAVARDLSGNTLNNQSVSFLISILQTSPLGTVVYSEIHNAITNEFGLVNLEIGNGFVVSGNFSTIDWSNDSYFIKIEMDESGGTNYQEMGTSQLLSVPYALHAEKADNVDDADADPSNELQTLTLSGDTLFISNGNYVLLSLFSPNYGFSCGSNWTDMRDGNIYSTIQIGTQCWMAENLNIGTKVNSINPALGNDSLLTQTDNDTIEKYCYDDNESNCALYGGLYQWDEMMQYTIIEETQGVCPVGWHIPTDAEWCILENFVDATTDPGCSLTGWRGTDGGTNLKQGGLSGFVGLLAGYRDADGTFGNVGVNGYFWSSNETGSSARIRNLNASEARVYRGSSDKLNGLCVRCVKD